MKRIAAVIPLLIILAAPMVMLHTIWTNPVSAGEDDVIYYYPLRKMAAAALRQGRWPLINTLEAGGMPLMADPQAALMFPPTWMFAVMEAKLAYSLSVFLAFSLAGGGMYLYCRRLGLLRPAACFGAVAFMFCGFMVGHRVHLSMIQTAAFLPWGFWCVELLRDRPWAGFVCMVAAVFGAIAAGHWGLLSFMAVAWTVYLLARGRPLVRSVVLAAGAVLLAAAIAAPQLTVTAEMFAQATRKGIGYATVGENSFFPPAGVLALFPMLMGSRTPNFFPQQWWGPWHLCEMLGYVGLSTLALAGAAVWKLRRKQQTPSHIRGPVRIWTWIAIGAGIWMLGYYLPTYRLIHMLPVLGVVRCPARMVLVLDLALAVLAAIAIHVLTGARAGGDCLGDSLARATRRATAIVLPIAMLAALAVVAAVAALLRGLWTPGWLFFVGEASDALQAVRPDNPAVWVPIALVVATIAAMRFYLASPKRRAPLLVALLLVDLFFVTGFVDVPADGKTAPDPEVSPAASWLRKNAPQDEPFFVWGLGKDYFHRAPELLLPKTGQSLGFATLASYGAWQSPTHVHVFGFNNCGVNRNWRRLLRRNYLLSLYGVRYILAAEPEHRKVIESVRVGDVRAEEGAPSLLGDQWTLTRAEWSGGGVMRLRAPLLLLWSTATQPVKIAPATIYRMALDARAPEGEAANFLRAEIFERLDDDGYRQADEMALTVDAARIGSNWRHFEWTFRSPEKLAGTIIFRVFTMSERTIEVRGIRLRKGHWPMPVNLGGRLKGGQAVYKKVAELPPLDASSPPVAVYENRLCLPARSRSRPRPAVEEEIEELKWSSASSAGKVAGPPQLAVDISSNPQRPLLLLTVPAVIAYVAIAVVWLLRRRGR